MLTFTQFCNFCRALGKSDFLKIAAQAFDAGYFINIFLRFRVFRGSFSLSKKYLFFRFLDFCVFSDSKNFKI